MHSIQAVAFDLGNTLVGYYERESFNSVLFDAIASAYRVLSGRATVTFDEAQKAALAENHEREDGMVNLLATRLEKIFGLGVPLTSEMQERVSRAFLQPICDRAKKYDDCDPTLQLLRDRGYKLAIVSNTPWGSPSSIWREELKRHGLSKAVDASVFCVDVGWRKPAPSIFRKVLEQLDVKPNECLFVGDEIVWDIEGACAAGMPAVLIDRAGKHVSFRKDRVEGLDEIAAMLPGVSTKAVRQAAHPDEPERP